MTTRRVTVHGYEGGIRWQRAGWFFCVAFAPRCWRQRLPARHAATAVRAWGTVGPKTPPLPQRWTEAREPPTSTETKLTAEERRRGFVISLLDTLAMVSPRGVPPLSDRIAEIKLFAGAMTSTNRRALFSTRSALGGRPRRCRQPPLCGRARLSRGPRRCAVRALSPCP